MKKVPEQSVWDAGVTIPKFKPLAENLTTDVVVIGGGLTGVVTAYLLNRAGVKVVLLEKDKLGFGATGVTTAFLTQYIDTDIQDLISMFGTRKTAGILAAHQEAIDRVEQIVQKEQIACEFMRCANYVYATAARDRKELQAEQAAGKDVGMSLLMKEEGLPFAHEGYLELANQAKFHPLQYVAHLVGTLKKRGVRIYEETKVVDLVEQGDSVVVTAGAHTIKASHAVVATYAPFNKKLFFKKAHYTSYVLVATVPSGAVPEAIYEDTDNPYHYWRVDAGKNEDRVIFGGADHRSDIPVDPDKNWQALEEALHAVFADIPYELVGRWSGPILETVDGLAYMGPVDSDHILYATGFSGNGMTYAHIAARVLTDAINHHPHPWQTLFSADRRPNLKSLAHKGRDYSEEMMRGAIRNSLR